MSFLGTRKAQSVGGSSLVITLPKKWVKDRKITRGTTLNFSLEKDGSLNISDSSQPISDDLIKTIQADSINDTSTLFRLLLSAYLMGYTFICVKYSKQIPSMHREMISEFSQMVIGPEIIREDERMIILKDILDPKEMPFHDILKRMEVLVKSMHHEAISLCNNKDVRRYSELMKSDKSIDRLYWLCSHKYHLMKKLPSKAHKMDCTLDEAFFSVLIGKNIERIADHSLLIADAAMMDTSGVRLFCDKVISFSEIVMNLFSKINFHPLLF